METEFQNQSPVDGGEQAPADEPQFVTSEQLNSFGEKLAGDMKAMFGRVPHLVEQQMKAFAPQAPAAEAPDNKQTVDPKEEVQKLLKEDRARLEAEKQSLNRQRIRSSLESSLVDNGADPGAVKLAADSLMMRNAEKLEIQSNELGESSVQFRDSEFAEPVTVNDFVKSFLSSQEGRSVLQQKKSPSSHVPGGKAPVSGEIIQMTRAEAATADPKLLMSGRVRFVD